MKIGEGSLSAMGRVGWDEIGQALKAFPDSIGPMEEPGLPFTATSAIVSDQMGYDHDAMLDAAAQGIQREPPEPEIELGD
jgi:hypothetical protein